MKNIITSLEALKNDAEQSIIQAMSIIPDPKKLKEVLEVLPQLMGMQSMEESTYSNQPLFPILDSFGTHKARLAQVVITNLFGGTKISNIEFTNPKIHPILKSFVNFDAVLDNNKGTLIMTVNSRQIELEKIKAEQNIGTVINEKSNPFELIQSVFFIPENGFGPVDLTNLDIIRKSNTIDKKLIFDNF